MERYVRALNAAFCSLFNPHKPILSHRIEMGVSATLPDKLWTCRGEDYRTCKKPVVAPRLCRNSCGTHLFLHKHIHSTAQP